MKTNGLLNQVNTDGSGARFENIISEDCFSNKSKYRNVLCLTLLLIADEQLSFLTILEEQRADRVRGHHQEKRAAKKVESIVGRY